MISAKGFFQIVLFSCVFTDLRAQVQAIPISPAQTDPSISKIHGNHIVYLPKSSQLKKELVLMIVGTGGLATDNRPFDSTIASWGYHVISLDYNNTVITTACSDSKDITCFNTFRQEIIFGTPISP